MRKRSLTRRPNLFDGSAFFDFFASGGGVDIAENARMQRKEFEGRKCLVWHPTSGWNTNGIARFPFEVKGDIKISFDVYNTAAKKKRWHNRQASEQYGYKPYVRGQKKVGNTGN